MSADTEKEPDVNEDVNYYIPTGEPNIDRWAYQRKNDNALVRYMIGLTTLKMDDEGKFMEFGIPPELAMRFYGFISDEAVKTKIPEPLYAAKMAELRALVEDVRAEYADNPQEYERIRVFLENVVNLARDRMRRGVDGFDRIEMRTQTQESINYAQVNQSQTQPKGILGRIGNMVRRNPQ